MPGARSTEPERAMSDIPRLITRWTGKALPRPLGKDDAIYTQRRWKKLSAAYRARNPFCECGALVEDVHHVIPILQAPELAYEWSNLVALCRDCHRAKHRRGAGGVDFSGGDSRGH